MYDNAKGNLPTFFDNYFTLNSKIHKHNTRSTNLIHKKGNTCRTNCGKFSIKYTGTETVEWNTKKIKDSCTKKKFKTEMKIYLLSQDKL